MPPCIKRAIADTFDVIYIVLVFKGPIHPCIKRAITDSSDVMNIALVLKGPLPPCIKRAIITRVSHITPFFELSLVLLTTHAIGLYEVTKKFSAL